MHEFSISSEVVKTVLDTVERSKGKKVLSIQLEMGELTLLNLEQVTYWIQELFKGTIAEEARIKVKTIKVQLQCNSCGYKGRNISKEKDIFHHSIPLICPKCGSLEINIEKGKECILRRIQVLK
jgi:hydrogenase nickel incorporation protein HypA/HybF